MNEGWHAAHPMPRNPSRAERVAWHLEHAKECARRPVPVGMKKDVEALGRRTRRATS